MPTAFLWSVIPVAFQIGAAYLNIHVLIPRLFRQRRFWLYVLSLVFIISLVPLVMNFWAEAVLDRDAFAKRFFDNSGIKAINIPPAFKFIPPVLITVIVLFISSSYALARDFIRKERSRVMLEQQKAAAELRALRSQMNPHFIFNALNNLNAVSKVNPERTELFIERLSEMMRYVMGPTHADGVDIKVELASIESYLFFQKEKDPDHTIIDYKHEIDNEHLIIEPMLIIPLLENAFKHGYSVEGDTLMVDIDFKHKAKKTTLTVKNSLPATPAEKPDDPAHSGIGLVNIEQRLRYRYPKRHTFTTQKGADTFTVKLEIDHEPSDLSA